MHISDGILELQWLLIWWVVALAFIAIGVIQIRKRSKGNPQYLPTLALMGAAIFVVSVWHIPVPVTGSCSHPIGTPLSAIVVGPFPTVILSAIALFFQSFVGHGGITTVGANSSSMGIVATFTGFGTWIGLRKFGVGIFWAAGLAGFVGDVLCYVTTAFELAVSLHPEELFRYWTIFALGFLPTQLPIAIVEFVFTGLVVRYIADVRPEMLKLGSSSTAQSYQEVS
ncbi:MAG: energy-coupling factor ABC transporter permease [Halobacteriota archaeon]